MECHGSKRIPPQQGPHVLFYPNHEASADSWNETLFQETTSTKTKKTILKPSEICVTPETSCLPQTLSSHQSKPSKRWRSGSTRRQSTQRVKWDGLVIPEKVPHSHRSPYGMGQERAPKTPKLWDFGKSQTIHLWSSIHRSPDRPRWRSIARGFFLMLC